MITRVQIQVRGIVQGVGFRPFVFSLARKNSLNGRVLNNGSGVLIDVEGEREAIDRLLVELKTNPPSLARIESIDATEIFERAQYDDFRIEASVSSEQKFVPISPDVATCADCVRELFDPDDRRFRYPFINCTNCGPRFTIVKDVPYDREKTTMREFAMCDECRAEYENPLDRRFHAEPIACAKCGPRVSLFAGAVEGADLSVRPPPSIGHAAKENQTACITTGNAAIYQAVALLNEGKILAIKGIGGFHLACDALNATAVTELRRRKYREDKPFALMAPDPEFIREYCLLSSTEADLLSSAARPIVLLHAKPGARLPDGVAPRVRSLGFMLPYAPLHHLLFEKFNRPLVMTSANISDEPICYEDEDARQRLGRIADYFLVHDRRIHMRMDDSVVRVWEEDEREEIGGTGKRVAGKRGTLETCGPRVLRRSRGYAPAPLKTGMKFEKQILACGAELKNTFCLARGDSAFMSHHIGDLENLETLRSFSEGIEHYKRLFYLEPEIIAYDLHPEYLSSKYALALDSEIKLGIQHHHAHVASCMADNQIDGDVIGVAMDGLGFGTDGRMWGGEFLVANFAVAERISHLEYMPMPGGARAIREPWRMAAVYLQQTFGDDFLKLDLPFVKEMDAAVWTTLKGMIASRTNCPETSSMGRLFDAVSSLLRLRDKTNYEGQAAIELEQIADVTNREKYDLVVSEDGSIIRPQNVIRRAVEDLLSGVPPTIISARFHLGVADLIAGISHRVRDERKLNRVVLSGGVFQNLFLLRAASGMLRAAGFEVFTHARVPANDGGISLGQVAIANARL
ncbi:MAG: (NiFe) hydrogenase maturation protein HypF [Acidobacteria bacterium]|nr:(NiFe) hydrogenase maturation protein HypF [Acidobacteriota bacterium]